MKIITRSAAIKNLKKYIGKDLRKLALKFKSPNRNHPADYQSFLCSHKVSEKNI